MPRRGKSRASSTGTTKLKPDDPLYFKEIGNAAVQRGEYGAAVEAYGRGIALGLQRHESSGKNGGAAEAAAVDDVLRVLYSNRSMALVESARGARRSARRRIAVRRQGNATADIR